MQLSMTVLRCPDQVAPEARSVSGGEFNVGRGPDVDWVFPDPDRLLSKRHFAVAFRGGAWQVADTSTNGTFLNTEADCIGRGAARSLRDGDRLRLGAYEIEIRLEDQPAQGQSPGGSGGGFGASRSGPSPFGDPFGHDPMAPTPAARRPFDEPAYPDLGMGSSAQLPHDFDPLAPDHDDGAFGGGFRGPVQADHSSLMQDAMVPPPIAGYTAPHTGGISPADDLLPDNWDEDLLEGIAPPQPAAPAFTPASQPVQAPPPRPAPVVHPTAAPEAAPAPAFTPMPAAATPLEAVDFLDPLGDDFAAPDGDVNSPPSTAPTPAPMATPTPVPVAAPVVRQRTPRPAPPTPTLPEIDPFNEPDPGAIPAHAVPPSAARPAPMDEAPAASPFDEPSDPIKPDPVPASVAPITPTFAPAPVATPVPAAASRPAVPTRAAPSDAVGDDGGALAAFFKGAELSDAKPADPLAMMNGLGMAFRAMVAGLRAVLIARATIKSEFRIEQTMIRARGNNPLKFSANDDDALTALLGVGRRTDMAPAAAIEDSLRDLRLHEIATMAAMQVAVRAMLDELSPDKIRAAADPGGMLPLQRKARAWDAFEVRHATIVQALVDDFDSIFGKSFARAYERALDEITTREQQ